MAVTFFPFNSIVADGVPDRPANAENLAAYLAGFFSNGVVMQTDTALQVESAGGMNVQIHAGMGNIKGKTILNNAAEIVTLAAANASLDRIDRVVFRLDEVNRLMEFAVLTGTPATSPTAPALTQGADVYELCLAEIRVPAGATSIVASYITDTRANTDLCGTAHPPNHTHDITDVGAVSIEKLWTNASPTSSFPDQNITVDWINDYDLFVTEFRLSTTSTYRFFAFSIAGANSPAQATMNVGGNTAVVIFVVRNVLFSVNGYVQFGACTNKNASATSTTTSNTHMIPVNIYGIKGVL